MFLRLYSKTAGLINNIKKYNIAIDDAPIMAVRIIDFFSLFKKLRMNAARHTIRPAP